MKKRKEEPNIFKQIQDGLWNIHKESLELHKKLQKICPHEHREWKPKADKYFCNDCDYWFEREGRIEI